MAPAARAQRRPLLAPYSTCRLRVTTPAARAQRHPPFASPNGACRLLIQQRLPLGPSMMPVTRPSQRRPPCTPHPAPLAVRAVPIDHAVYLRPSHARCALAVQVALVTLHMVWPVSPLRLKIVCVLPAHAPRQLSVVPRRAPAALPTRFPALSPGLLCLALSCTCSGATHDTAEPMNHC
jgi:hypothetical protein